MDKNYQPKIEKEIYQSWLAAGLFADNNKTSEKTPYTIVFPPPNVTGELHMGHALIYTLQDLYSRFNRMRGYQVMWNPGFDHAGIATQLMVERELLAEGTSRQALGREKFLQRVWQWKGKYSDRITKQFHALGVSCNWDRLRFTLDSDLSVAVDESFIELFNKGLIYRDLRLVNWDIKLQTAVSDLEVKYKQEKTQLYTIAYPLLNSDGSRSNEVVTVATVRPETIFGDVAVAVNPDDARYQKIVGRKCLLPLMDKAIPIIADAMVSEDFGTGAVKITPGHDFNDFKIAKLHDLPLVSIFDAHGNLNKAVPDAWQSVDRKTARLQVIAALEQQQLLVKTEKYLHNVPVGERSGTEIEPRLTKQWFADAKALSDPVLAAMSRQETNFHPQNWQREFCNWLKKIEPWCISRQLWWGHRIPAWFTVDQPQEKIFVAKDAATALQQAIEYYGHAVELRQDEDVLDTWFSSALWPFSIFGWPEKTATVKQELARYYPADLLVTGNDILFFWVARMQMLGLHNFTEVAFKDVFITALVKDTYGQKMSKTKGNVINPLESIQEFGADSLRMALLFQCSPGRDIRIDLNRVSHMRNFTTKIWHAIRFIITNYKSDTVQPNSASSESNDFNLAESRWLFNCWNNCLTKVTHYINSYRIDLAAQTLYKFLWNEFCDWYIELIKLDLHDPAATTRRDEQYRCAILVASNFLQTLHPFMPFISENLWNKLFSKQPQFLIESSWPEAMTDLIATTKTNEQAEIEQLIFLVKELRSLQAVFQSSETKLSMELVAMDDKNSQSWISKYQNKLEKLSNLPLQRHQQQQKSLQIKGTTVTTRVYFSSDSGINIELTRLQQRIIQIRQLIDKYNKILKNENFLQRATGEIVAEKQNTYQKYCMDLQHLEQQQQRLQQLL